MHVEGSVHMLSAWRDIAVFLDASPEGDNIGRQAAALARVHKAHLVAVYGVAQDANQHRQDDFVRGSQAIRDVIARRRRQDEHKALAAGRRVAELSREYGIGSEFRVVWRDTADDNATLRTLHCDLIIAAHPKLHDLPKGWSAERLLLASGIPVLLVPHAWNGPTIGASVMIAWNGSREARRAINDAMPFISLATKVTVLTVDDHRGADHLGEDHGASLLRHLAKHEGHVEIRQVSSHGAPIAEVILAQATERDADLLIVGAYSRPRTTEILFGSITRALLAHTSIPLLISR